MRSHSHELSARADRRLGFVDLTDELLRAIKDAAVSEGFVIAFCRHTTCALIINEWEEGVLEDLRLRLAALVPANGYYAHDDFSIRTQNLESDAEPANGAAHVAQMILGATSHTIPVESGEPVFGRWQRLFLLELDEPRARTVRFSVYGA